MYLIDQGLEDYVRDAADCIKRGEELAKMCMQDYEVKLNIANPLHRKKLDLAIKVKVLLKCLFALFTINFIAWFDSPYEMDSNGIKFALIRKAILIL